MARTVKKVESKKRRPPAKDPEARENQLIALAIDVAEKQLSEGTASAQVITHYLKLGTTKERLEKEKLARENELLRAKTEAMQSQKNIEALYKDAINAMKSYNGIESSGDEDED